MRNFLIAVLLFSLSGGALSGCGGGGGGGGDQPATDPKYDLKAVTYSVDDSGCLKDVSNYCELSEYTSDDGKYKSWIVVWCCASYKGQSNVYVSLTFENDFNGSSCLELSSEYISSGICN